MTAAERKMKLVQDINWVRIHDLIRGTKPKNATKLLHLIADLLSSTPKLSNTEYASEYKLAMGNKALKKVNKKWFDNRRAIFAVHRKYKNDARICNIPTNAFRGVLSTNLPDTVEEFLKLVDQLSKKNEKSPAKKKRVPLVKTDYGTKHKPSGGVAEIKKPKHSNTGKKYNMSGKYKAKKQKITLDSKMSQVIVDARLSVEREKMIIAKQIEALRIKEVYLDGKIEAFDSLIREK